MSATGPRVCVVGAGSSGIASCQVLQARAIEFDCFEKGSEVGGNWRYGNGFRDRIAFRTEVSRVAPAEGGGWDVTVRPVDGIVYCTGYRISFPFLDRELLDPSADNRVDLYRQVVPPDLPGLYFIGLVQPLGAIMPIAEQQSEWIADVLEGRVQLPGRERMRREIDRDRRAMSRRYVASKRHTIQVDFHPYLRQLRREREAA